MIKKTTLFIALSCIALGAFSRVQAQCAPVSAKVCVSGDDTTEVWLNGSYLGLKNYCDLKNGCHPESLCFPIPLDKISGPQVCLALKTTNINPVKVFSSWELEVDCAGDKPFVVTDENPAKSGVSLYWDPTGGSTCGMGHSPPVDDGGNNWTNLGYNPSSNPFTLTGMTVTASTYTCAQIANVLTGFVIQYISYDADAAGSGPTSACGILYWRQVAKLPVWLPTATPIATLTSTRTPTPRPTLTPIPTPTENPPPPATIPTPKPRHRPTATHTPVQAFRPIPTREPRRAWVRPTATYAPLKPTPAFYFRPRATWTPVPPREIKPTPVPTWVPHLEKSAAIVFQTPPVEIYVNFADGPGRYQLEVLDGKGTPLAMIFDKKIVGEQDAWVVWDGKDSRGQDAPIGQYFVIFYKDGKPLRSISVYRSGMGGNQ
jgi:hypothetical protein